MALPPTATSGLFSRLRAAFDLVVHRRGFDALSAHFAQVEAGDGASGPAKPCSQVAAVFGCVRAKADALGGLPLVVSSAADQVVESGPLVQLVEQPAEGWSARAFWRATSAHLDLHGQAYWWLHRDAGGRPVEVVPINPLCIEPKRDQRTGELTGWLYRPFGRQGRDAIMLGVDEIHRIADPDFESRDPLAALSPRHAVASAIAQVYKADVANESSLDNGVEPGGVFTMEGRPSTDQIDDTRQQINERHAGVTNRRRPLLLWGGLKWQQMAATYSDMEFAKLKGMATTDICAGFGVPPAVVGYYEDSNYSHATAAEQAFWTRTILPRAAWLADEFTAAVLSRFQDDRSLSVRRARQRDMTESESIAWGRRRAARQARRSDRRYYAWFDSSDVAAVQAARLETAETATKWQAMGVPLNAIIKATDAPFQETAWGNTWWRPFSLIDVQADAMPGDADPDGAGETGLLDEPTKGARTIIDTTSTSPTDARDSEALGRLWQQWRASWSGLERAMNGKVGRHFHGLRKQTLANLAEVWPDDGRSVRPDQRRDLIGEVLFDLVEANRGLIGAAGPILREAVRLGGEQALHEIGQADEDGPGFSLASEAAQTALRRREVALVGINRTLARQLRSDLASAMTDGKTLDQVKDLIRQRYNVAGGRAATIARTEIGSAVEQGQHIARVEAGVPLKSWLSSRKATGRATHALTEQLTSATPVPLEQDFQIANTGVTCPHPRATGLAEHDINCGCTTISRYPGDTVRDAIARIEKRGWLTYEQLQQRDTKRRQAKGADRD